MSDNKAPNLPMAEDEGEVKPFVLIEFAGENSAFFDLKGSNNLSPAQMLIAAEILRINGEEHIRNGMRMEARKKAAEKMDMMQIQSVMKGPLRKT